MAALNLTPCDTKLAVLLLFKHNNTRVKTLSPFKAVQMCLYEV